MPWVDIEEALLEIAALTGFTRAFAYLNERPVRTVDLWIRIGVALLAQAGNTSVEPFVHTDILALKRSHTVFIAPIPRKADKVELHVLQYGPFVHV